VRGPEDTGDERDLGDIDAMRVAYLAGDPAAIADPAEREDLDDLLGLLADPALWIEPDEGLEERVVLAVQASADEPAAGPLVAPRRRPGKGFRRGQRKVTSREPTRGWRVGLVAMGVAAAVVVGFVVSVALPKQTPPAQFTVALGPTALQPTAKGSATLAKTRSGWKIQLEAKGLPRRDKGRFYQAWLVDARGVFVPVGTFNEGEHVTLWAGVPPKDYPTLTVTVEQAGDSRPVPSRTILSGRASQKR